MRNTCLILLFIAVSAVSFGQKGNYFQQKANYFIQVQLDDILNSLDGYEKLIYTNNSPDTLHFIWFHLWPNAYKDETTAFGEQLLRNGRTDFYFSNDENRGYISHLSFKVDDVKADTQHHPKYVDAVKVILPQPLAPGSSAIITTPFHVKLPYNFSRGGHIAQNYQITQWYPKPAVYDNKGWHPIPYLDQGEFYSEFGKYDVQITLPENYLVAASGILQDAAEKSKLLAIAQTNPESQSNYTYFIKRINQKNAKIPSQKELLAPRSKAANKTLHYTIDNAHDFAWFASKQFIVQHDTVQLQSKMVDVYAFYPPWSANHWDSSIAFAKSGLRYYDKHVGSYPYSTATVVSGPQAIGSGGMEYPSITLITTQDGGEELDATIAHELGHNWFYGALASNERDHAWMDEGMNSFYESCYRKEKYKRNFTEEIESSIIKNLENIHKDQPIDITSDYFTMTNYGLFVYVKTAAWMRQLRKKLGSSIFEKSMKDYYNQWQFRHPYPENFKQSIEASSHQNIDSLFSLLSTTSAQRLDAKPDKRPIKLSLFLTTKDTDKYRFISLSPVLGYNAYDKLMVGVAIHNYALPLSKFNFIASPIYSTGMQKFNYYTRASYRFLLNKGFFDNININASASSFTYQHVDVVEPYNAHYDWSYTKIDPTIRFNIRNQSLLSSVRSFIQLKTFFITEGNFNAYSKISGKDTSYISNSFQSERHLAQLRFNIENYRALYPYSADVTIDGNEDFIRAGLTAKCFFNYPQGKGKGLDIRFFAGKFFHLSNDINKYDDRYYLNLTGPRGNEDYNYSNYFVGRTDYDGFNSQQLMERDGFFKVGTELQGKTGKTDNWLSAINFSGDIPFISFKNPFKLFLDLGTYSEAWQDNATGSHFLYDAGLQVSLFKGCANLYVPLLMSSVYSDYYNSIFPGKKLSKSISFSLDIQKLKVYKLTKGIPF